MLSSDPLRANSVELRDVHVSYGATPALIALSMQVTAGECLAVVGESGSGKTTFLRLLNRLVEPDRGSVLFQGQDLRGLDPHNLRRGIGYVPQDGGLLPHWRVLRNVELVPRLRQLPDVEQRAHAVLSLVGLDPKLYASRWPHELSGGQRQRVALARALAASPQLLLLDEAFSALDAITRADVQDAFDRVRRETRITTILVTHDLSEAMRLADRVAVLRAGRLEQLGTPAEVVRAPATPYVETLIQRAQQSWPRELRS